MKASAVDDGGGRGGFAPLSLAVEHHEKMVDPLEQAGVPPCIEMTRILQFEPDVAVRLS
jgi:hypothetical protein